MFKDYVQRLRWWRQGRIEGEREAQVQAQLMQRPRSPQPVDECLDELL